MSYDIRTPMNAIIGFTNIALHQDSVPEIHNCLKKIEDSSDHHSDGHYDAENGRTAGSKSHPRHAGGTPGCRRNPHHRSIGQRFAEDVQTSLDAGMNGHISKPLNVAEVAKVIARNLNKV